MVLTSFPFVAASSSHVSDGAAAALVVHLPDKGRRYLSNRQPFVFFRRRTLILGGRGGGLRCWPRRVLLAPPNKSAPTRRDPTLVAPSPLVVGSHRSSASLHAWTVSDSPETRLGALGNVEKRRVSHGLRSP